MKYFIILLIANFVFFGCEANNTGDAYVDPCVDVDPLVTTIRTIRDQAGLQDIANDLTARYILCENITINTPFTRAINHDSGTDNNTATFEGDEFTGTLDGNGKTISELEIQAASSDHVGLFGQIGASGEVRNLHISLVDGDTNDPSISGNAYVGALVGKNYGTITNVAVTGGYVKGDAAGGSAIFNAGGLVGYNAGTIENSYATSKIEGRAQIGGLVGHNEGGVIEKSYATGTAEGDDYNTGGLVGANSGSDPEIIASYFDAALTGQQDPVGINYGNTNPQVTAFYTDNGVVYTGADAADRTVITQDDFVDDNDNANNWDFTDIWAWQEEGRWPLLQFQTMTTQ